MNFLIYQKNSHSSLIWIFHAEYRRREFELAMNIAAEDPERRRLQRRGWKIADPHQVARTPTAYRRYLATAFAEFTAIKGVDVAWRTGWVSDRAAAFLALGPSRHYRRQRPRRSYLPAKVDSVLCTTQERQRPRSKKCCAIGRGYPRSACMRSRSLRFGKKS